MKSLLVRAFVTVRAWLGLNDPAENRLHAAHGWLLPGLPRRQPAPVVVRGAARRR